MGCHQHANTWQRRDRGGGGWGLGFGAMQKSLGESTNNILGLSSDGIWFPALTMTNCQEYEQSREKQLCGPNFLNNGLLCSLANPDWKPNEQGRGDILGVLHNQ